MKEKAFLFFVKHCEQNVDRHIPICYVNFVIKETGIGKLLLTRRGPGEEV